MIEDVDRGTIDVRDSSRSGTGQTLRRRDRSGRVRGLESGLFTQGTLIVGMGNWYSDPRDLPSSPSS